MKEKNLTRVSETVLLAYFMELSEKYVPSTLWATYSMLKSTLKTYDNFDIYPFTQLLAFLKQRGKKHQKKKSKDLTEQQVYQFLTFAPDHKWLAVKVALIFGINGACRHQELHDIKMQMLQDEGNYLHVTLSAEITKNFQGRTFSVTGRWYTIVKKYLNARPQNCTLDSIFLTFRDGKCTNSAMGINALGAVPRNIATYLKLPDADKYIGHALRRSSATIYCNAGGILLGLKDLGGWKSDTVAQSYRAESLHNKKNTCNMITNAVMTAGGALPQPSSSHIDNMENKQNCGELTAGIKILNQQRVLQPSKTNINVLQDHKSSSKPVRNHPTNDATEPSTPKNSNDQNKENSNSNMVQSLDLVKNVTLNFNNCSYITINIKKQD
ncbi:uncharacterized protein LOC107043963 [Diachasma alloeum]|uniref:uncharacterized protein LOC107043963 n=1 Tax=Diachasma alloeum TaxID=454923 RepID=UPI0007381EE6|nr:uncharacterized protein LOC107043963 [Diachasma alloeum]